jgi:hypothetical protein
MNNCYIKQECFGYPNVGRRLLKETGCSVVSRLYIIGFEVWPLEMAALLL